VTLQNFETVGGDGSGGGAGFGGALFINSNATVTLNNVSFLANYARGGNGGVGAYGGSLNNLFNEGSVAAAGTDGYTPLYNPLVDTNGASGTREPTAPMPAANGGFGGPGGNGSNGTDGGGSNPLLALAAATAAVDVATTAAEIVADAPNPFTANVAAGKVATLAANIVNLAVALVNVVMR